MLSVIPNSIRVLTRQKEIFAVCARTLHGSGRLGVDSYRERRKQVGLQLADSKDDFYRRIEDFADGRERSAFADDLNQLLHVATADEQDQTLLRRLMTRFHEQSKDVRFGKFIFGPVVMRMYWHHELADKALEAFHDPALDGFFDQLSSYVLLMDLLYKQGRDQDVLDMLDAVQQRQLHGAKFPNDCVVLTLAACCRMNSAASYEHALALLTRLESVGHSLARRSAAFGAALMLRQGEPHKVLQLLRNRTDTDWAMLRDLQAIALAELDRPAQAVEVLRQPLLIDQPQHIRDSITITQDTMDSVEAAVQKKNDAEVTSNWKNVKQGLESYGLLKGKTLDEVVNWPILAYRKKPHPNALGASFNRGQPPRRSRSGQGRPPGYPGLTDMVD